MPTIQKSDMTAWDAIKQQTKGYNEREDLRVAIADLDDKSTLRIKPDGDEPMRKMKVMVRWAAKEVGKEVQYAENSQGELVVRLGTPTPAGKGAQKAS